MIGSGSDPAMDDKQRLANLAANLKGLCRGVSIAVACREIGLNRQQFNKYLSGRHHPSRRSLALICGYFSVAEKDLYRNPAEFSATYHSAENWRLSAFAQLRRFQDFSSSMPASDENIRGYIGLYHRYHFSSIYHGTILRSIMEIYEKDGLIVWSAFLTSTIQARLPTCSSTMAAAYGWMSDSSLLTRKFCNGMR